MRARLAGAPLASQVVKESVRKGPQRGCQGEPVAAVDVHDAQEVLDDRDVAVGAGVAVPELALGVIALGGRVARGYHFGARGW